MNPFGGSARRPTPTLVSFLCSPRALCCGLWLVDGVDGPRSDGELNFGIRNSNQVQHAHAHVKMCMCLLNLKLWVWVPSLSFVPCSPSPTTTPTTTTTTTTTTPHHGDDDSSSSSNNLHNTTSPHNVDELNGQDSPGVKMVCSFFATNTILCN